MLKMSVRAKHYNYNNLGYHKLLAIRFHVNLLMDRLTYFWYAVKRNALSQQIVTGDETKTNVMQVKKSDI